MLYGNLEEVLDLVNGWNPKDIINAYKEVPKKGLNTEFMGKKILYWASIILDISKRGLKKRDILNNKKQNEEKFLDHLQKIINNNETNADHMISEFSKEGNLTDLYDK